VFSRQYADTGRTNPLTFREYADLGARTSSFVGLLAHSGGDGSLQVGATLVPNAGERIHGARVSSNFFEVLGVGMAAGRGFLPVDDSSADAERSVVLSYDFWQRRFGGDAGVVGQPVIVFRDVPFTVVGVAARGFHGIEADERTDAWWPVSTIKIIFADRLDGWNVTVMGRLKPGVPLAQARADAQVAHASIVAEEAAANPNWNAARRQRFLTQRFEIAAGRTGIAEALRAGFTQPLYALMASVAAVLIIACANVGALLLARTTARRRELAVRLALGSGRARIIQQLVTENALLIVLATMGGVALVPLALRTILSYAPAAAATALDTAPDFRTVAFAAAMALPMAVIVALLPAIRSTRALDGALGAGTRGAAAAARGSINGYSARKSPWCWPCWWSPGCSCARFRTCAGLDAGFDPQDGGDRHAQQRRRDDGHRAQGRARARDDTGCTVGDVLRQPRTARRRVDDVRLRHRRHSPRVIGGGDVRDDAVGPRFFETTSTAIVAGRAFATGDEPRCAGRHHQRDHGTAVFRARESLNQLIQGKLVVGGGARHEVHEPARAGAADDVYTGGRRLDGRGRPVCPAQQSNDRRSYGPHQARDR
jgi:hypothetical protein